MKITSASKPVNVKVGFTPLFHDLRKVLVKLRPAEHRIAETLWGVAHGRWDETFSRQYLCVCTETKPKYLQEILKSLTVLGLIRMERLGRDKYRFEPASPSQYPEILETLAQRPKLGRPKGSTNKKRVVSAAEVPVKVRAREAVAHPQLALFGDGDLEYRQSFIRSSAQLELPGVHALEDNSSSTPLPTVSSAEAHFEPPVALVNRTPVPESSEEEAPLDAVSLAEQEMNEWSAHVVEEVSPKSKETSSVVPPSTLIPSVPSEQTSVPSEQTPVSSVMAPISSDSPPSAPVSEVRPAHEVSVPGDLLQFDPALLTLAKEAISLLKAERPRDIAPNLRTLCPLLAPMVQASSVAIVLSYLKEQMASMCGRPSVASPLHVLCSPKWYVRGLQRVSKATAPRKPTSIKVTNEIEALISITNEFPIESLTRDELAKNVASLLELGTLGVASQYLRETLIELMPQARSGQVTYPLQVACHVVRAREGMWQIEKSQANREIARTFNSLVDSQVLKVASSDKAVDPIGSLMSPWLKGKNVKPTSPAPLKLVQGEVTSPTTPAPTATPAPAAAPVRTAPMAPAPAVQAPVPTTEPTPTTSKRAGYRMPWDTQEQAQTNQQGARAALAALHGPSAQATLSKEVIAVDHLEDGMTRPYKGFQYVYVASQEIWKRTKVIR